MTHWVYTYKSIEYTDYTNIYIPPDDVYEIRLPFKIPNCTFYYWHPHPEYNAPGPVNFDGSCSAKNSLRGYLR